MNTIKRDVYVLRDTIKIPIEVTKGTDAITFEFTIRDYNLPATAAAVVYAYHRTMTKPTSILCDVSGNVISFQPEEDFFKVGMNELQIRVINEEESLISFKEKVKCSDSIGFPDDEEEKQKTLIEQLVSYYGKETGERKMADAAEKAERQEADATEKAERQEADAAEKAERQEADATEKAERQAADATEKAERQEADATEKAERQAEINVERERINNLTKLGEGSTTGDAELADIRVGANGKIYDNAGEAVRSQVSELKEDLSDLSDKAGVKIITDWSEESRKIVVTTNEKLDLNATVDSSTFDWQHVLVSCTEGDKFIVNGNGEVGQGSYAFLDSENTILSKEGKTCVNYITAAPKNAVHLFIQRNSNTTLPSYKGEPITDIFENIKCDIRSLEDIVGTGKNRFDGKVENAYISEEGVILPHTIMVTTGYIRVKSGERIRITANGDIGKKFFLLGAYDEHRKFIPSLSDINFRYFDYYDVPDGVGYVRATFNGDYTNVCIYDSTTDDLYYADSEYHKVLDDRFRINPNQIEKRAIERIGVGTECLDFTEKSVNLLDKTKAVKGLLENTSYGVVSPNEILRVTDFIYLKANTIYSISLDIRGGYIHLYNPRFEYFKSVKLDLVMSPARCFQYTPEDDCYARLCFDNQDNLDNAMVVEGSIYPSEYVPYFCKIKKSAIYGMSDDSIDFYLPETVYVASGRTIDLFYSQFFLQADRYHIRCMCDIGIPYENRFSISCNDTMIGNSYPLVVSVYNDNLEIVYSQTVNISVVSNKVSNLNMLPIGDSLTQKPWLSEIQNLSNGNISFIGQHNYSINDADGNVRTGGCQGVPGWTAGSYLTTNSPFYNSGDGTYSLGNYCNAYLDGQTPDAIIVWLGTNALQLDPTGNAMEIKNVVDMLRNDGNIIPVFVLNTIYKSTQDAIGRQANVEGYKSANGGMKYMEDKKVFNLMNVLGDYFKDYANIEIVPCAITMDAVNGFGAIEVNINSRCTRKKLIPSDSVHPQPDGYYQIADTVFSAICGHYNGN